MEFSITFDEQFFKIFKQRWLNTKELLLLLINIDELIKNGLVRVSNALTSIPKGKYFFKNIIKLDGDYFLFFKDIQNWKKDFIDWDKRKCGNILECITTLKVNSSKINCSYFNSSLKNIKKRCYYLIRDKKYILIHYRSEIKQEKIQIEAETHIETVDEKTQNFARKKRLKDKPSKVLTTSQICKFFPNPTSNIMPSPMISPKKIKFNKNIKSYPYKIESNGVKTTPNCNCSTYNEIDISSRQKHIKIIDFAPNTVIANTTSKIFIIIESYLNFQNLKMLENQIRIKFSEDIFMPCTILNSTTLSSIIPYGQQKEVILEIFIGNDSVSTCNQNTKLKYIDANYFANMNLFLSHSKDNNTNQNKIIDSQGKNKNKAVIFELTDKRIKEKISQIFNELKSLVLFYKDGKSSIKSLPEPAHLLYEYHLRTEMEKMLNEFDEIEKNGDISRLSLVHKKDDNGYDIIHYISALKYPALLDLFSKHTIELCELSRDNLTPYEIAAGKWNSLVLTKLIELIDTKDNDEILYSSSKEREKKNRVNIAENPNNKEKIFYNMEILRSAFNLALDFADKNKINPNFAKLKSKAHEETNVIELLLKQIRIQLAVNSTSDHIISAISDNMNNQDNDALNENSELQMFTDDKNNHIMMIQKYIRGWLRRSQYNGMKNEVNKLKERCKVIFGGKEKFCNFKMGIVKIQKNYRRWTKKKIDTKCE